MPLVTRDNCIKSLSDPDLKKEVCETLGINSPDSVSNQEAVDRKFFYSGINARWFCNRTIDDIKKECTEILQRLDKNAATTGAKDPGAVNSAVATILANDRIIHVYTSCYLAQYIGSSKEGYHDEFLKLFPFVKHTLGTGTPGDIFESDFRLHLEHSHKIRDAQVAVMGDQAEEVMVCLGTSATDGSSKVQWPAGEIKELPDPPADKGACQRTKLNPPTDERTPLHGSSLQARLSHSLILWRSFLWQTASGN